jgi:two-component system, chemotaxis family, protein-glutamate methylesterase/glutaminase
MLGKLSGLTCPECDRALSELHDRGLVQFRCRAGHAFSAGWLLAEQSEALQAELLVALRTLKEQDALARWLTGWARGRGDTAAEARFDEQARAAEQRADLVRRALRPADAQSPRTTGHLGGSGHPHA